jgi:hypothetical protein
MRPGPTPWFANTIAADSASDAILDYIRGGGGALVIHAANNSFGGWKEYEQMVGLLWRPPTFGYSLYRAVEN